MVPSGTKVFNAIGHEVSISHKTNTGLRRSPWEDLKLLVRTQVPFPEEFLVAGMCWVGSVLPRYKHCAGRPPPLKPHLCAWIRLRMAQASNKSNPQTEGPMAPALYNHFMPVLSQLGNCQDRKPTVISDSRLHVGRHWVWFVHNYVSSCQQDVWHILGA